MLKEEVKRTDTELNRLRIADNDKNQGQFQATGGKELKNSK